MTEVGYLDESAVGRAVYTRDGDKIGEVKEVRGAFFKVDAPMQPDYWLQSEFAQTAGAEGITMEFGKDDLGDYKVKNPPEVTPELEATFDSTTQAGMLPESNAAADLSEAERRARL
jgi:hypothetical protein